MRRPYGASDRKFRMLFRLFQTAPRSSTFKDGAY
jgi:hypothetical protein